MDVYLTIYRGETAEDEIEINIEGFYQEDWDSLEILKCYDTFDDSDVELTPEELKRVEGPELDEFFESNGRGDLVRGDNDERRWRTARQYAECIERSYRKAVQAQMMGTPGDNQ
tara:strand:- start:484 stop:825 length:342 start_codon:yes stop_codon:yes gene_type:complete